MKCLWIALVFAACARPVSPSADRGIPFTLTPDNAIVLAARINATDVVHLALHTATSDVRLTTAAVAKISTLEFSGGASVESWGGGGTSRVSTGNRLSIGGWRRDGVTVWEDRDSSTGTDGKVGLDVFGDAVVELDFEHGRLALHDRRPDVARYERLSLTNDHGALFVSASCVLDGARYTADFLVHSGYGGGILLADELAASSGIGSKIAIRETSTLVDSFGHTIEVRKGILPGFALGATQLADVPVGFFAGALGTQRISVIGTAVLMRFHILFDVAHDALYLQRRAS